MMLRLRLALTFLSGLGFIYAAVSACTLGAWFTFGRTSLGLMGLILALLSALATYSQIRLSRMSLDLCLKALEKDFAQEDMAQTAVSLLLRDGRKVEAERVLTRHLKATLKSAQVD